MNTFVLHLQSATQYERIEGVASFTGHDASGSFGILAGHARMMSLLSFGLARFRPGGGDCEYVAVPGALIYFRDNQLFLNTRRYLRGGDYETVRAALRQQFLVEERELRGMKQSLQRLEQEMYRRLLDLSRERLP